MHSQRALEFLLAAAGSERVLMGSDYPFDMGEFDCVTRVEALSIPRAARDAVLGVRAKELLGNA
jgi:aminocarboxymuconate-semialdehyde decarboxylase